MVYLGVFIAITEINLWNIYYYFEIIIQMRIPILGLSSEAVICSQEAVLCSKVIAQSSGWSGMTFH